MSDANETNAYQVVMPRLGLTMTEARILEWLRPPGGWVEKGQPLFVIENEKATLEIEAPAAGRLTIQAAAGQVVPVLGAVALLSGGTAAGHHAAAAEAAGATGPTRRTPATPRARAAARRRNLDLAQITGSGPGGLIVAADIEKTLAAGAAAPAPAVHASPLARKLAGESGLDLHSLSGSGPRGQVMRRDVERASRPPEPDASIGGLSGLRAVIAGRLSRAWRERPQVTLTTEADATLLVEARAALNAELAARAAPGETPQKVSYNALFVRLAAQALADFPYMNTRLTENGLEQPEQINIGLAVDSPRGLLVPVLADAGRKPLLQINAELAGLAGRALQGRCLPEELTGGSFTITNLGAYEIDAFTPIINPPECAILGVGRIAARPVGQDGQIALRQTVALSLSFDHRLVDGAPAARFLQRIKQLVERPYALAMLGW